MKDIKMTKKTILTALCVCIATQIVTGSSEVKTAAMLRIDGSNSIVEVEITDDGQKYEVGKSYEVSFSPATEEAASNPTPAAPAEAPDAPVSEGQAETSEPMKEAA